MTEAADTVTIRPVHNDDSPQIIDLVGRCFADYPGCILDVETEETGLLAPADAFERFWVAERDGTIVGTIAAATRTTERGEIAVELKKLYVCHSCRGSGLARRLVDLVEEYAREHGAVFVDLWSDTKFDKAHRVYAHYGYVMGRAVRDLHDLSNTREYYFRRDVRAE